MFEIAIRRADEDQPMKHVPLPLDGSEIAIGREPGNHIVLDQRDVSRWHARVVARGDHAMIIDLRSSNGTYLNRERVAGVAPFTINDVVRISGYYLTISEVTDPHILLPDVSDAPPATPDPPATPGPPSLDPTRPRVVLPRVVGLEWPRVLHDSERELLALIHAAPDDDGPRLVYADWLLDHGDPRGELIAMQCELRAEAVKAREQGAGMDDIRSPDADRQRDRIAKLATRHAGSWLGGFITREQVECVVEDDGACRLVVESGPGRHNTLILDRGFLDRPLCVSPAQLGRQRDHLMTVMPTLYEVIERVAANGEKVVYKARVHGPKGGEGYGAVMSSRSLVGLESGPVIDTLMRWQSDWFVQVLQHDLEVSELVTHDNLTRSRGLVLWGKHGDVALAREWVEGWDVGAIARGAASRGARVPEPLAVGIASQLCLALHQLYRATGRDGRPARVLHRAIRPDHVLVSERGEVKLTSLRWAWGDPDVFPVSYQRTDTDSYSHDELTGPQLAYYAPETVLGEAMGPESCVFSVGVILYELLCGEHPFHRPDRTDYDMLLAIRDVECVLPGARRDVSPELAEIIARAMQRPRGQRYASPWSMHRALEKALADRGWSSAPDELARYLAS